MKVVGCSGTDILLVDHDGRELWTFRGAAAMVHAIALSPSGRRVAFVGVDRSTMDAGVFWAEEGSNELRSVKRFGRYPQSPLVGRSEVDRILSESLSLGWSEDSTKIVYSESHSVQIFDIAVLSEHKISDGDDPSWSPDGKCDLYRSLEGRAMLIGSNGAGVRSLGSTKKIMSMVHWSPDSQFIFVDEDWGTVAPQSDCVTNTRLVVYRSTDGASLPVYNP